jgi:predicted amidophosphoribosyltransferase
MTRYMCSSCHEVVESAPARFAFCGACGAPLTTEDLLPVHLMTSSRAQSELPSVPEAAG